jgi:hypothetical protein
MLKRQSIRRFKSFVLVLILALVLQPQAMAVNSFIGSAVNSSNNGGNVVITLPSLVANDLIIVAYVSSGIADLDMMANDGAELADLYADDTSADANLGVYFKIATGSETTITVTGSGVGQDSTCAAAMVFRGVDTVTPFDVTSTTATGINTMHPDPPTIDWSSAGTWVVIAGASAYVITGSGTHTFPTGYTVNGATIGQNDTRDCTVGLGYNSAPSDPEDPGVMTNSGTDSTSFSWAAVTMALRPAATGAAQIILIQ